MFHRLSAGRPLRRRLSIFITAVATVVSTFFVAVAPATPAHADLIYPGYCERYILPNGNVFVQCWPFEDIIGPILRDPGVCPVCYPIDIDFRFSIDVLDPAASLVQAGLFDGLRLSIAANYATDPQQRAAYRTQALSRYSTAAANLGHANLAVAAIWRHFVNGQGDPSPQPSLSAFQQYANQSIAGVGYLRAAQANPKQAAQLTQLAQAAFDKGTAGWIAGMQSV